MNRLDKCGSILDPRPTSLPEAELVCQAQNGDASAFEGLYRLHCNRVYALCLRMMKGDESEAEDLTQEAFLQVFRKIRTFRAQAAFSTWLHRVAFNVVLMRLRKRSFPEVSLEQSDEHSCGHHKEIGTADSRLLGSVDRVNLQRAVHQLPAGYRAVFLLHDVGGYEHNEIARILGCSIGNSKSQLHKARMLLRRLLMIGQGGREYRKRRAPLRKSSGTACLASVD
jgi:RNA polymerase sigma-70 factor, ECF subfamily